MRRRRRAAKESPAPAAALAELRSTPSGSPSCAKASPAVREARLLPSRLKPYSRERAPLTPLRTPDCDHGCTTTPATWALRHADGARLEHAVTSQGAEAPCLTAFCRKRRPGIGAAGAATAHGRILLALQRQPAHLSALTARWQLYFPTPIQPVWTNMSKAGMKAALARAAY